MNSTKKALPLSIITIAATAVIAGSVGFVGGMQMQKIKTGDAKTLGNQQSIPNGTGELGEQNGGRMINGTFGTVTAISATSISVQDIRQNTAITYKITTNTVITNSGASASTGEIEQGEQVMVQPDSNDATAAARISIGTPGGRGMGPNQRSNTTDTDDI